MTRDLTHKQFAAAAKRAGFRLGVLGLEDTTSEHFKSYGYVFQRRPFKMLKRESLARAIQARKKDRARTK